MCVIGLAVMSWLIAYNIRKYILHGKTNTYIMLCVAASASFHRRTPLLCVRVTIIISLAALFKRIASELNQSNLCSTYIYVVSSIRIRAYVHTREQTKEIKVLEGVWSNFRTNFVHMMACMSSIYLLCMRCTVVVVVVVAALIKKRVCTCSQCAFI